MNSYQKITNNILQKQSEVLLPCFIIVCPTFVTNKSRAKEERTWLPPSGIKLCTSAATVNLLPHGGQIQGLWGWRQGSEHSWEPSIDSVNFSDLWNTLSPLLIQLVFCSIDLWNSLVGIHWFSNVHHSTLCTLRGIKSKGTNGILPVIAVRG